MSDSSDSNDSFYGFDSEAVRALREKKPWMRDPRFINAIKVGPAAVIKMMMHGQSGVEKGIKGNGKPVEVMGLLLGHPNPNNPREVIISDAQPLPVRSLCDLSLHHCYNTL